MEEKICYESSYSEAAIDAKASTLHFPYCKLSLIKVYFLKIQLYVVLY